MCAILCFTFIFSGCNHNQYGYDGYDSSQTSHRGVGCMGEYIDICEQYEDEVARDMTDAEIMHLYNQARAVLKLPQVTLQGITFSPKIYCDNWTMPSIETIPDEYTSLFDTLYLG